MRFDVLVTLEFCGAGGPPIDETDGAGDRRALRTGS
jgi:hypothetical protein